MAQQQETPKTAAQINAECAEGYKWTRDRYEVQTLAESNGKWYTANHCATIEDARAKRRHQIKPEQPVVGGFVFIHLEGCKPEDVRIVRVRSECEVVK